MNYFSWKTIFTFFPSLPPSFSFSLSSFCFCCFCFCFCSCGTAVLWSEPRAPCMPELRKALQTILAQGSPQKGRFAGLTLRPSCPWLGKGRGNCGHLDIERSSVHRPDCLPSPIPHPDVCEEGGWGHQTPSATQSQLLIRVRKGKDKVPPEHDSTQPHQGSRAKQKKLLSS